MVLAKENNLPHTQTSIAELHTKINRNNWYLGLVIGGVIVIGAMQNYFLNSLESRFDRIDKKLDIVQELAVKQGRIIEKNEYQDDRITRLEKKIDHREN